MDFYGKYLTHMFFTKKKLDFIKSDAMKLLIAYKNAVIKKCTSCKYLERFQYSIFNKIHKQQLKQKVLNKVSWFLIDTPGKLSGCVFFLSPPANQTTGLRTSECRMIQYYQLTVKNESVPFRILHHSDLSYRLAISHLFH